MTVDVCVELFLDLSAARSVLSQWPAAFWAPRGAPKIVPRLGAYGLWLCPWDLNLEPNKSKYMPNFQTLENVQKQHDFVFVCGENKHETWS